MTRDILIAVVLVALVALGGIATLVYIHDRSVERVEENRRLVLVRQVHQILPADTYDNNPVRNTARVQSPRLGTTEPVTVYRALTDGEPAAAIIPAVTTDSEGNEVRLLIGVLVDGTITGVRIAADREGGNSDRVLEVNRSDWIRAFDGLTLEDLEPDALAEAEDPPPFLLPTGGGLSPPTVLHAVRHALLYFEERGAEMFMNAGAPPDGDTGDEPSDATEPAPQG